mgnify:CR=1 FL=1
MPEKSVDHRPVLAIVGALAVGLLAGAGLLYAVQRGAICERRYRSMLEMSA